MRPLLFALLGLVTLSSCAPRAARVDPVLERFSFNYKVLGKRELGVIQVFSDERSVFVQLSEYPRLAETSLSSPSGEAVHFISNGRFLEFSAETELPVYLKFGEKRAIITEDISGEQVLFPDF